MVVADPPLYEMSSTLPSSNPTAMDLVDGCHTRAAGRESVFTMAEESATPSSPKKTIWFEVLPTAKTGSTLQKAETSVVAFPPEGGWHR